MPKDSQIDNKKARMQKCNNQIPLTSEEGKNHNKTSKKQSIEKNAWQSH